MPFWRRVLQYHQYTGANILDWLPYVVATLAEDVPNDWPRLLEIVQA